MRLSAISGAKSLGEQSSPRTGDAAASAERRAAGTVDLLRGAGNLTNPIADGRVKYASRCELVHLYPTLPGSGFIAARGQSQR